MQIDHDTIMLLVGAGIGLSSSLITSLFQAWLSKREFNRQKEYEKRAELKRIVLPTVSEIQMYNSHLSEADKERLKKALSDAAENNKSLSVKGVQSFYTVLRTAGLFYAAMFLFVILLILAVLIYLIYKTSILIFTLSPIALSVIVAIGSFVLVHLIVKSIINKWKK